MRKEPKWKYFVRMAHFLMGRFGFDKPLVVVRDNRIDCPCCVDDWNDAEKIKIQYHSRRLGRVPYCYVLSFLLHEIGHLVNEMPYATDMEVIESEREAERFSNETIKEEYPEVYKQMIKEMRKRKSLVKIFREKTCRNPYYWAYKELKEYKITTSKEDKKWLRKKESQLKSL